MCEGKSIWLNYFSNKNKTRRFTYDNLDFIDENTDMRFIHSH